MVEFATNFAKMDSNDLSTEERNVLSVAFKNVVGSRRAAWRVLTSIEQKEMKKDKGRDNVEKVRTYKWEIEEELLKMCWDILDLCDNHLIWNASTAEAQVFYKKMKGDYYRYIAEFTTTGDKEDASGQSWVAYDDAFKIAKEHLEATHPIWLGLALNFSVFYYEIL